ncbi:MAG: preprotein translocase subunit SecE [Clostridiales bacterium]|nr:preprotein translocase subunit SecE [Clostridiales bacterium]
MSFSETVQDYKAEFHKIIWPKRDEVFKKTGTVIITSLIVGAVIFCMDTIYTSGYDLLLSLLTK